MEKSQPQQSDSPTKDSSSQEQQADSILVRPIPTSISQLDSDGLHDMQTKWKILLLHRAPKFVLPKHKQYQESQKSQTTSYKERFEKIANIVSIEHFFGFYVYLKKPSELPKNIDFYIFRENELPMWEESPNGGVWMCKIDDPKLDQMWENLAVSLIGEQFEELSVIGIGISIRLSGEKYIQVWLKDGRSEKMRTCVSNKLRHFLNLDPDCTTLYYKEHSKSIVDQSTLKNAEGFKFVKDYSKPSYSQQTQFYNDDSRVKKPFYNKGPNYHYPQEPKEVDQYGQMKKGWGNQKYKKCDFEEREEDDDDAMKQYQFRPSGKFFEMQDKQFNANHRGQ